MTTQLQARQSELNWESIRERVDALAATIAAAQLQSSEARTEILAKRAHDLAQPLVRRDEAESDAAVVARLGDTLVAFSLEHVVEVIRPRGLTPLPGGAPPATLVIGWMGRIMTVLNLANRAVAGGPASTASSRVLILGERRGMLGVLVDDVDTVRYVRRDRLHPAPREVFGGAVWISGMTDDVVAVADVPALIAQHSSI